jgi:hypothetical protein
VGQPVSVPCPPSAALKALADWESLLRHINKNYFIINTMLREIATYNFLLMPIFAWFGILAFSSFSLTALVGLLNQKGIHKIPFSWHPRLAKISFLLAAIHVILAFSLYF